ncbi:MAG: PrsW family intramembrane metalloprotease [Candidatus Promineifilaceae bacterium]
MALQATFPITFDIVIFSIIAAVIPTIFFVLVIYWFDHYEKEPIWLLAAAFLWGAVPSIIAAFILNTGLGIPLYLVLGPGLADATSATLIAPPVEETLKGLALIGILLLWRQELDSPLDGIIYGAMVGLGFAMIENIYYFLNVYAQGGAGELGTNIFIRSVIFGLNHALFTSMTGLGIAVGRLAKRKFERFAAPIGGWMAAMFFHFVHNLTASLASAVGPVVCLITLFNDWGGVLLILAIILWSLYQERSWIKTYLAEEVDQGLITQTSYENAASGLRRTSHYANLLFNRGPAAYINGVRFYHRCSELAYKKHNVAKLHEAKSEELTQSLRKEIRKLQGTLG